MSLTRLAVAAMAAVVLLALAAAAGPTFRLEIGPPIAAGSLKDLKKMDKKAVLAVRALACDDLAMVQITGTAEGLVNSARQSLPIVLNGANRAEAIYFVSQQWPESGAWVLHLKGSCSSPKAEASTLVAVRKGTFIRETSQVLPGRATQKQIEAAVRAAARSLS